MIDPSLGRHKEWTLLGADGLPAISVSDNMISIVDAEEGLVSINLPGAVTAALPPGRYTDALRVIDQELADTCWTGTILVDANP